MSKLQDIINSPDFDMTEWLTTNAKYQKFWRFNNGDGEFDMLKSYSEAVEFMEKRLKDYEGVWFPADRFDFEDEEDNDRFFEKFGCRIIKEEEAFNSCNFDYHGPVDYAVTRYLCDNGERYYFISLYGGGDSRNNWLHPYVIKTQDTDEAWLIYDIFDGEISYYLDFKDGSSITLDNYSDIQDFEAYPPENCEHYYQLTIDGNEELVKVGDSYAFLDYVDSLERNEMSDAIDDIERYASKIEPHRTVRETMALLYEQETTARDGMIYGWTMMPRGAYNRIFLPKMFYEEVDKRLQRTNNEEE